MKSFLIGIERSGSLSVRAIAVASHGAPRIASGAA